MIQAHIWAVFTEILRKFFVQALYLDIAGLKRVEDMKYKIFFDEQIFPGSNKAVHTIVFLLNEVTGHSFLLEIFSRLFYIFNWASQQYYHGSKYFCENLGKTR